MGNVNARQPGLVGLLDTITDGKAPGTLVETISGVIDLQQFILLGKRERIVLSAGANNVGAATNGHYAFPALPVPNNEAWLLQAYTVQGTIAAASQMSIQVHAQMPLAGGNQAFPLGPMSPVLVTGGASQLVTGWATDKLWLPPGTIMGFTVQNSTTGVATTFTGLLDFVRVRL